MARPIHFLRLSVCVAFALTSLLHGCGDEPASPTQETDVVASDLKDQADSDAGESDLRGDTIHDTDGDPALPELSEPSDLGSDESGPGPSADTGRDANLPDTVDGADMGPPADLNPRDGGGDSAEVEADNGPCRLPADPAPSSGVTLLKAFELGFERPVFLTHAGDGSDRLFVVEQGGRIRVFPNDPQVSADSVETFLEIPVSCCGERGLLGLAFHPNYASNGQLYVNYTAGTGNALVTRISRFDVDASDPQRAEPDSEEILLEVPQPYANHNGGAIAFGPDGYLYIGMGDGGLAGDPLNAGQDNRLLLGAMLRIDVNAAIPPAIYGIPPDNPFAGGSGPERPEIWAWGLRNPWRFSFDALSGALWVGDVGQDAREEVHILEGGKNYGWNRMEGSLCYSEPACDTSGLVFPLAEYEHSVGRSITGGYVYRGHNVPALYGSYVYADFMTMAVFIWRYGQEPSPTQPTFIAPGPVGSFGTDEAGELYLLTYAEQGGSVYRFVADEESTPPADFPQTLSETGCFASVPDLIPGGDLVPYELNVSFWSDTAQKRRYLVLPEGTEMVASGDGQWDYPAGTLAIKHFELPPLSSAAEDGAQRLETRFLVYEGDGQIRGYTYRWNDAGDEAFLLTGAETQIVTVEPSPAEFVDDHHWQYPSRTQCGGCHTAAAGGLLGLESGQLNRMVSVDGQMRHQFDVLGELGLLSAESPGALDPELAPRYPAPTDPEASLASRARAYLHTNCASCHRPGGPTGTEFDARFETPLAAMMVCDEIPQKGGLDVPDLRLIAPGESARSAVWLRLQGGPHGMPPFGPSLYDAAGSSLIASWIDALDGCGD